MSKLILGWGVVFFLSILPLSLYSQNNAWRGFVSYPNGFIEPSEAVCDFIKDGQLRIAPSLSDQAEYVSNLSYNDTVCLARNFSLELRLKNNATIGGIGDFENQINLFSNGLKSSVVLSGSSSSQINTQIKIGDSLMTSNKPFLVVNPSEWHTVKMRFFNSAFQLFIDGSEVYKAAYTKRICNLDIMKFVMKGGGAIDWIKIYDNNDLIIWQEEFTDCKNLTKGIICDPFQLDKSVTISRPCENDTLTLMANFPAMSYRWSTPEAKIDTNKVFKVIKPTNGLYDLTANVNACFTFYKSFSVSIQQSTTVKRSIRLCQGQYYELPSKKIVNTEGVYRDTVKTKSGCDSIVVTTLIFDAPNITNMNISICTGFYALPSGRIVTNAGLYRDTTKDVNGCLQVYDVRLNVGTNISTTTFATLCEGERYRLPKGQFVTIAGTYRDTFKSIGGCDSLVTDVLTYTKKPIIKLFVNRTDELFEGDPIILTTTGDNGTYRWFENSTLILNGSGTSLNLDVKGGEIIYKVTLSNLGCINSDSIKVVALSEIKLPNVFTPNHDNQNDNFSIVAKNENLYKIIQFDVYNRIGKKVYNNGNGIKGWDGMYNNEELVSDSYIYLMIVQSPAGRTFKYSGEVLLLR
jgi:gliding motility-associated-like protein